MVKNGALPLELIGHIVHILSRCSLHLTTCNLGPQNRRTANHRSEPPHAKSTVMRKVFSATFIVGSSNEQNYSKLHCGIISHRFETSSVIVMCNLIKCSPLWSRLYSWSLFAMNRSLLFLHGFFRPRSAEMLASFWNSDKCTATD